MSFSLLKATGILRVARANEIVHSNEQRKPYDPRENRYSGIPQIPADVGYKEGHGAKKQKGKLATIMEHNPFVILGCGLTAGALLGMIYKSFIGDKMGTQKYMQYRIMAQFFTVTALVAGVTIFASFTPTRSNGEQD